MTAQPVVPVADGDVEVLLPENGQISWFCLDHNINDMLFKLCTLRNCVQIRI